MFWIILFGFIIVMALALVWQNNYDASRLKSMPGVHQKMTASHLLAYGEPQPEIICPHCQEKGSVLTKKTDKKNGISGAKATGAILTGGVSLLATGLSQKDRVTQAHCVNCNSTWIF